MTVYDLKDYILPGYRAHLVGIGGVSMSTLAEALGQMGLCITGSDMTESPAVSHLRSLDIDIFIGHSPENIDGVDFLIRTAAARDDNPEIIAARERGIPVFERAQAWGFIMKSYKNAICISGTHGKTTTTSMTTHILMAADCDPTVMIGGTLPILHTGHHIGGSKDIIVLESCEYYNSFHSFFPTVAVILNIEADHLDFFKDLNDVKKSFREFAALVPEKGYIIANADDANTLDALAPLNRELFTFGFGENADVRAVNIRQKGAVTDFDILLKGKKFTHISLKVPGRHNILNALAATAAAITLDIPATAVAEGLGGFIGAMRRFEYRGSIGGARIYDDYAHHPTELRSLLNTVESLDYKRIILAFQPHTYTRTSALFDDFVKELSRADLLFLSEIYAAREQNALGISSEDLAEKIPGSVFCPDFEDTARRIEAIAADGDIILTVGAGDIYRVGDLLLSREEAADKTIRLETIYGREKKASSDC